MLCPWMAADYTIRGTPVTSQYGAYEEFVAELYDAEYSGPGLNRGNDVEFFIDCSRRSGGHTLELGCGTGRVLVPTAVAGCQITGFDLSEFMLAKCRSKLSLQPQEVQQRVRLVQGNMTGFSIDGSYSLVTIPFRPFQHLVTVEEQKGCLNSVRKHLAPDGLLVFDVFNPRFDRLHDARNLVEVEDLPERQLPDGRLVRRASRIAAFHRDKQYNDIELIYYVRHPDGRSERLVQSFRMRYFFRYELEHLLELCGFRIIDFFGDFDRSPYSADSREMIFVAAKASL